MNIKRAKQEIIDTVEAYLQKDDLGDYLIPLVHQRPILLLGAPGIGKTRIMEQIAAHCQIALVSYTITHHTRQSAIGLPYISEARYKDHVFKVTEYTMSEIVASIYKKMEMTGLSEGILFLDEINCVSETLAPAMLQFLQYKSFGSHVIPSGWIIVTAGNPPEYNKSVREFDLVTMDRLKKIEVEPDLDVWKEYAYGADVHPAIISYLNTRPLHFCKMETTVDGRFFATPRGWEDLSRVLQVYEQLKKPMDKETVVQYIQYPEIARDFAAYLELFYKYQDDYQIDKIFQGEIPDILIKKTAHASFDEKLGLIGLLLSRCQTAFRRYGEKENLLSLLHTELTAAKPSLTDPAARPYMVLEGVHMALQAERLGREKAELLTRDEKVCRLAAEAFFQETMKGLYTGDYPSGGEAAFSFVRECFSREKETYEQAWHTAGRTLEYAFDFLEAAFGSGQELVIFLTELNASPAALRFLGKYSCERYYRYNRDLLLEDRTRAILRKIDELS